MPNMIEMLLNSGNNSTLSELSSRFGLSEDQTRQAVEALAPALSIGMKRNASSPMGAGALIEALSSSRNEQFSNNPVLAVSDEGVNEGNKILGHLLGSKDVSRAVTEQASKATGIGQSALKQMLPMLASVVMGSMSKNAKMGIADGGAGGGILGKIMEGMLGGKGGAGGAGGLGGPLGDLLGSVLGGGASRGGSAPQRRTSDGDNPLGRVFEDMLSRRGNGGIRPQPEPQRRTTDEGGLGQVFEDALGQGTRSSPDMPVEEYQDDETPSDNSLGEMLDNLLGDDNDNYETETAGQRNRPRSSGKLTDIFGDMIESGRKADDPYQGGLESIFDKFMKR